MDAIYAGTAKIVPTKFGEMTKVSFNRTDLEKMVKYLNENDTEWINLVIKEKKEKQPGKPTHYLQVDDWKPTAVKEKNEFVSAVFKKQMNQEYEKETLPF